MQKTSNELFERFAERLGAVGGEAHFAASLTEAAETVLNHPALKDGQLLIPPGFASHPTWGALIPFLQAKGIALREASTPADAADAPAGLSGAELAIAETGSVMLAENALEARIVSMLTLTHIVLVQANTLYPMLEAAGQAIQRFTQPGPDQRRYISLVTGPSRTADIERTLTIGVQGPKALCVIMVESL